MLVIKNNTLRKTLKLVIPFIISPILVLLGATLFSGRQYSYASILLVFFAIIFFICGFEKKSTGTRRLVIVSVMIALSVVGRFIPFFKPITALTIITAIYLGGECGFLVGAMSAVISNLYFGQGPWTPFQMLAWGIIGLVAGYLSAPLKKSTVLLLIFGAVSGIVFSFIMDIWTVVWYNDSFNKALYISALATATPITVLYSVSNIIFLCIFAKPIGEKLDRIKVKYGV